MDGIKKIRLRYLMPLAVLFIAAAVFLRGPHISNQLKKLILPELELLTGNRVIARVIYINPFPLFAEAKDVKIFDDSGERIVSAERVKAYVDLSGLLDGRILIRRLVIKKPLITTDRAHAEEIISHAKAYIEKDTDAPIKARVLAVEVQDCGGSFTDPSGLSAAVGRLRGEVLIGDTARVRLSADSVALNKPGWPSAYLKPEASFTASGSSVKINSFSVASMESGISGSGEYAPEKTHLKASVDLVVENLKRVFGLTSSGEGRLKAEGTVDLAPAGASVDVKVRGDFHLQTLMELLKVKEKLEGRVEVSGGISGPLHNLKGSGSAVLSRGNLFGVEIGRLKCGINYYGGVMKFSDGDAQLYNGRAKASASINLPVVNSFSFKVDVQDVDSKGVFSLIGWDPGIPAGKVRGTISSSGAEFDPEGEFVYSATSTGADVLGRVKDASGKFRMRGHELAFEDLSVSSPRSSLTGSGLVDVERETLRFRASLKTSDIQDIVAPHQDRLKGAGDFMGEVSGSFSDPFISGSVHLKNPAYNGYSYSDLDAEVGYRKERLDVKTLTLSGKESLKLQGRIAFKKTSGLFDFSSPDYELSSSLQSAELGKVVSLFYPDFRGKGRVSGSFTISGSGEKPNIRGDAEVSSGEIYGIPFDASKFGWSYDAGALRLSDVVFIMGKSSLSASASLDQRGYFTYEASAKKLLLSDIARGDLKGDAVFSIKSEGHGTFADPTIFLTGRMIEGRLKGKTLGGGTLSGRIMNKSMFLKASLLGGRVSAEAKGLLTKELPWQAHMDFGPGRYDFLVGSFLKDAPEDLIVSLNGSVDMHGDRKSVEASADIRQLTLTMYGYTFVNDREVLVDLSDKNLRFNKLFLRSGGTTLSISGNIALGNRYNVTFEGSSDVSPLKGFFPRVGLLKGDAEYVVSVTGDWDSPQINGGMSISNGSFGMKDYPYRVGYINGYLYIDNDRIVLQKLGGKVGGGDVEISGIVYLRKFAMKRFYVETVLKDITVSPSEDFSVNFGGHILYKGTPESQIISGDVSVNKARYRERIEWKSWLLKTRKAEKFKAEAVGIDKAALNISITGRDNIDIDNNVAKAVMSTDMILRGTVYHPVLFGRLETREGTVFFRNNEFKILHASADFSDPDKFNPVIEIAAETIVKGYKIKMNLEGKVDHFTMSLASDPALKEMDILALLTVGQTGSDLKGFEGGIGAGEATSFVTGKVQDVIEERFRNITGLDRFTIDPYVSKTTGMVEPRVTVSKRLLGDKVFVTYTSSVGSVEEQIIKLEYFLGKNVSFVGVRDERGILGGDVKFRFEFK